MRVAHRVRGRPRETDPEQFGHRGSGRPNWRHNRKGDKYVTAVIDPTTIRDGTGPVRLLDVVEGRSKAVFKTWLADRPQAWREGVELVAMDGFTGYKTGATEELPQATAVMDPLHVVRLGREGAREV